MEDNRFTVKCMGIGRAAGTAAAMAAAEGNTPRQIDVGKLRAKLRKDGLLPKENA